ncbi:hypothetical protein Hbl1158_10310 [Halobaculum sp. CBA1158]|uniref:hypothetical protein n=1 Tax=Halobaculum sp. CBA1158 TaxID=2904243 RepID=UPI001F2A9FE9|nr:hypothetical protein [Halobaculum sp. CBA1158]UIO98927.1 hypothetical protein Hbl1158_10310 [Halobaculum sp. CBA1158]
MSATTDDRDGDDDVVRINALPSGSYAAWYDARASTYRGEGDTRADALRVLADRLDPHMSVDDAGDGGED